MIYVLFRKIKLPKTDRFMKKILIVLMPIKSVRIALT